MGKLYNNILETIGRTPVIKLNKLAPEGINLYIKAEAFNPMGSVKDRLALGVIEAAERDGSLSPGQTVIEATSGNTGIGLAMVCAQKGYPLVVVMAENCSIERRKIMRFLGAKVVLTPASQKAMGMLNKAIELAETHGWFLCRQFENEANADIHSRTTAPEILDDFRDQPLDYWVTGFGTGGTLKGTARVLKAERPETQVVVCEPDNSQLMASGLPQKRSENGSIHESHPNFRPHLMQGWTPDFIPQLAEDVMRAHHIDQFMPINGADALRLSQELAQKEGIFTGISGGATLAGALQVCAQAPQGSTVLCMLPDTGERYLTTPLFAEIPEEMTAAELAISKSTPSCRFDAPPPAKSAPTAVEPPVVIPEAEAFVQAVINEPEQPVIMFALQWCEFCWSIRKLFAKCGIEYRSVNLDSVEYQADGWGGKIRAALNAKTGCKTIPQIFVGGKFIGGCTETFDAFKSGELQTLLEEHHVAFNSQVRLDPYGLLPGWLQPR
ncbi:MAG: pyridoxal-phosphate dependent enzyme [Cyanobacteria bacterium P01_A01_bin.123]